MCCNRKGQVSKADRWIDGSIERRRRRRSDTPDTGFTSALPAPYQRLGCGSFRFGAAEASGVPSAAAAAIVLQLAPLTRLNCCIRSLPFR